MSFINVQAIERRATAALAAKALLERERHLQELAHWLDAARHGGRILLIGAEAGMGKTSLLQEFARRQAQARVLWGACDSLMTPRPLAPLHDIARDTRGALSTLVTASTNRDALFNATLDEFERSEALVVFDDMHWADEATVDLLKFLGRRMHRTKVLLVVAYRNEDVPSTHPLHSVLSELPRTCTHRLALSPLSENAVADMAWKAGRGSDDLHRITGGNPLFVTELLTASTTAGKHHDLQRSLRIALDHDLPEHAARAYTNLTSSSVASCNYEPAQRYAAEGIEYCKQRELIAEVASLLSWRSRLKFELCDWNGAGEDAQKALHRAAAATTTRASALIVLGQLRTRRGDPHASAALEEARSLIDPTDELQRIVPLTLASAEAAWLTGNPATAIAELLPVYERALATRDPWIKGALAAALKRLNALPKAPDRAAEPYALELNGRWQAAARVWETSGCRHDQAAVLARYGDEIAQRRALAIFEELGSTQFAQALRRQMRMDGIRRIPRGSRRSTRDHSLGLTRREAQIFDLISEGLRNSEIAARLFLSTRTVDHHVSAVLTKLGVPSRAAAIARYVPAHDGHRHAQREPGKHVACVVRDQR